MEIKKEIEIAIKNETPIYIWGTKIGGSILGLWFDTNYVLFNGYVDNNIEKSGKIVWKNYRCILPQELPSKSLVIITAINKKVNQEILDQIKLICVKDKKKVEVVANCVEEIFRLSESLDDEKVIKTMFQIHMGYECNLDKPKSFNEKLNWLKLYDRKPVYTKMVDKFEAKKYVEATIGVKYVIPVLGIWDTFKNIDFTSLPNKFVLKCTHDSGGMVICKDKFNFDIKEAEEIIDKRLKRNFYWVAREWPYKNVKPRIIAEEYLENNVSDGLHDYKVWCFQGKALYVQYISGRAGTQTMEGFFNRNWELQEFTFHNPPVTYSVPRPECLDELLEVAEKLSQGIPFVRCDFYILENAQIKFGEMTFFPMAGIEHWHPDEMDKIMGDHLVLPYTDSN